MADAGVREAAPSFEACAIPDAGYREQLISLLSVQAAPMWSVGRQAAYEEHVMDGPSLDHWVRTADAWAQVERGCWELDRLLGRLGAGTWPDLAPAATGASSVAEALEGWIDLLFAQLAVDRLGAAMAQACADSSYSPLRRTARLVALTKRGLWASGEVGLREVVARGQLPVAELAPRAGVWLELTSSLAQRYAEVQDAGAGAAGLVGVFDVQAEVAAIGRQVHRLVEEGS